MGRGSHFVEMSKYFEIPLSDHLRGSKLEIKAIFDPASLSPSAFRVGMSFVMDNTSVDLLELGLDTSGKNDHFYVQQS